MSDLTLRLLNKADMIEMGEKIQWGSDSEIMREAAARIAELTAALRPFADLAETFPYSHPFREVNIGLGDLRAASAALEKKND